MVIARLDAMQVKKNAILKYGKTSEPFLLLYDGYRVKNKGTYIDGRYVKVSSNLGLSTAIGAAHSVFPITPEMKDRVGLFGIRGASNQQVSMKINDQLHHFIADERGRIQTFVKAQIISAEPLAADKAPNMPSMNRLDIYDLNKEKLVITDIDDTIKKSHTSNGLTAVKHIFTQPALPFEDAKVQLRELAVNHDIFYLSASFSHTYPMIKDFLNKNYPPGPLSLRTFNIFNKVDKDVASYKFNKISEILENTNHKQILLNGDSTQVDGEAYGRVYAAYKDKKDIKIKIRIVKAEQKVLVERMLGKYMDIKKAKIDGSLRFIEPIEIKSDRGLGQKSLQPLIPEIGNPRSCALVNALCPAENS